VGRLTGHAAKIGSSSRYTLDLATLSFLAISVGLSPAACISLIFAGLLGMRRRVVRERYPDLLQAFSARR
jgi:hypothetical protein